MADLRGRACVTVILLGSCVTTPEAPTGLELTGQAAWYRDRCLTPRNGENDPVLRAGSCYDVGLLLLEGSSGAPKSPEHGREFLSLACSMEGLGARTACVVLGNALMEPGPAHSPEDALRKYARGCTLKSSEACLRAGVLLDAGAPGVEVDLPGALATFDAACRNGSGGGCALASVAYATGRGVAASRAEALERAAQGCALDDGSSCAFAATLEPDAAKAAEFRSRACRLGEPCQAK